MKLNDLYSAPRKHTIAARIIRIPQKGALLVIIANLGVSVSGSVPVVARPSCISLSINKPSKDSNHSTVAISATAHFVLATTLCSCTGGMRLISSRVGAIDPR